MAKQHNQRYRHFYWVDTREEYCARPNLPLLPILRPSSPERAQRWERVLRSYGLTSAEPSTRPLKNRLKKKAASEHLLLAVGPACASVAQLVADAHGQRVVCVASPREILDWGSRAGTRSVTVVALPLFFTTANLRSFADKLAVPWTVMTATDMAALSFLAIKIMLYRDLDHPTVLLVDGVARRVERMQELGRQGRRSTAKPYDAEVQAALHQSTDYLILHAHGDGAHAKLGKVVLCGFLQGDKPEPRCRPAPACRKGAGAASCQRAWKPWHSASSPNDWQARSVVLLSCWGFMVAAELHPDSLSLLLSAVEGQSARILSPYTLVDSDAELTRAIAVLAMEGASELEIWRILNEIEWRRRNQRPYVLLGCVSGSGLRREKKHEKPDDTRRAHLLPVTAAAERRILHYGDAGVKAFRGKTLDLVIVDNPVRRVALVAVDRTREHTAAERWLREMQRRCQVLEEFAIHLRTEDVWRRRGPTAFQELLMRFIGELSILCAKLIGALDLVLSERSLGLWDLRLEETCRQIEKRVISSDRQMANLIDQFLLAGELHRLVLGSDVRSRRFAGRCICCAGPLNEIVCITPGAGRINASSSECARCGGQHARHHPAPRLGFRGTLCLSAASPFVGVVRTRAGNAGAGPRLPHNFIVHLFDRAKSNVIASRSVATCRPQTKFRLTLPSRLTPDLHSLRLAHVRGLQISLLALPCRGPSAEVDY